jgi:capsular exopolysaccharide synthesis family protein
MKKIVKAVEKRKQEYGGISGSTGFRFSGGRGNKKEHEIKKVELVSSTLRKNCILHGGEMESATMAYNMLRTQVYKQMVENGWTTLAVTSSNKAEGKSLTALNLAFSLSRSVQQQVIILDMDLRRPSMHKKLNIAPKYGMSDYFQRDVPITSIMFSPEHSDLIVMPGREPLENASELLASYKTQKLFSELKKMFQSRIIVLDLPPVLLVDDVMGMADHIDCSLLVVSESRSKKEELTQTIDLLQGGNIVGTVLNNSSSKVSGGGYDYYYGKD